MRFKLRNVRNDERKFNGRKGQALFLVMVIMTLVMAASVAMVEMGNLNLVRVRHDRTGEALTNASRLGMAQGKLMVWDSYVNTISPGTAGQTSASVTGNIATLRAHLQDTVNLLDDQTVLLATLNFAAGAADPGAGRPVASRGPNITVEVRATRNDVDARNTHVIINSTATITGAPDNQGGRRVTEQVLQMGTGVFQGFDFSLLANAVNCTFCHADFDNVRRVHNSDPTRYGTFPRVKVATLESLEMRGLPTTNIAGTLYVQGALIDSVGNQIDPTDWSFTGEWSPNPYTGRNEHGLRTVELDSQGNIIEDAFGNPITADFVEAGTDADGNYNERNATFYRNYDTTAQVDGFVPDNFPPVVPDLGNDPNNPQTPRLIDDTEWSTHTGGFAGTISGGTARVLIDPQNESYNHDALPDGSGASGANEAATIPSVTNGQSVILVGTEANPIVIDGDVAIDGDVIISGVVQGEGHILARRNLYVVGDVQYNDGTDASGNRTFGVDPNGGTNNVAYAAGGMISHGAFMAGNRWEYDMLIDGDASDAPEYHTDANGDLITNFFGAPQRFDDPGDPDAQGVGNMALQQMGWWNRMEYTRSVPYYDNDLQMPTPNQYASDGSLNPSNVEYVAGYSPRFYTFREGGDVWLFGPNNEYTDYTGTPIRWVNGDYDGDGQPDDADNDGEPDNPGFWAGDGDSYTYAKSITLQDFLANYTDASGADPIRADLVNENFVRMPLHPQNEWISQDNFYQLFRNAHADRLADNGGQAQDFVLDGLFYTSNGMLIATKRDTGAWWVSTEPNEGANGGIEVNGSIVAADTGILAERHLQVNYDVRTQSRLTVEDRRTLDVFVAAERESP